MNADAISSWTRGALRFFMVQYPTRTSLGIAGGVVVSTVLDMLKPYLGAINTAALSDFRLSLCGVFVTNIGLLFKRNSLPEDIEQEFTGIQRAISEGHLSQAHQ